MPDTVPALSRLVIRPTAKAHSSLQDSDILAKASGSFFGGCNCLNWAPAGWFLSLYTHCKDSCGGFFFEAVEGALLWLGGLAGEHTDTWGKSLMHVSAGTCTLKGRRGDWEWNKREMKQAGTCHENVFVLFLLKLHLWILNMNLSINIHVLRLVPLKNKQCLLKTFSV